MNERRKDVEWYEWLYQVSNLWRIKSLNRYRWNGSKWYIQKERIMKTQTCTNWYIDIWLFKIWKIKRYRIHRLVAIAFIKNIYNKPYVCHIDNSRSNNNYNNLCWWTQSENIKYAYDLWRMISHGGHGMLWRKWKNNILSKQIIQQNKNWDTIKIWNSGMDIQRELWYKTTSIASVCRWRKNYNTAYGFIWKYI